MGEKELARKMKEAERTQRVKNDITAQKGAKVAQFAEKQVPMQSVLVSMLSGKPGVTTSASANNSAIDAKREENLAQREANRNRSAAAYIGELNAYAEEQKARFRGTTEHQILTGERGILSF